MSLSSTVTCAGFEGHAGNPLEGKRNNGALGSTFANNLYALVSGGQAVIKVLFKGRRQD